MFLLPGEIQGRGDVGQKLNPRIHQLLLLFLKVGQNIDFHCTRIIHPRKILLGMPPTPDVGVVSLQRFDLGGGDAGGGFMGNIHIQGGRVPY